MTLQNIAKLITIENQLETAAAAAPRQKKKK
jgi:hypothetical protein